jgi:hypothetical protein
MYQEYSRIKDWFAACQYDAVIDRHLKNVGQGLYPSSWEMAFCTFYCALAYAHKADYHHAITTFEQYISRCRGIAHPSGVVDKCGVAFIARLSKKQPEPWYEVWQQMRRELAPIDALIEDLWDSTLPGKPPNAAQTAYLELQKYGTQAIPALLDALDVNDRNAESIEYEQEYPKQALLNIGDPAFEALKTIIMSGVQKRLMRAAIKLICRFGDDRAEPVLHEALHNWSATPKLRPNRGGLWHMLTGLPAEKQTPHVLSSHPYEYYIRDELEGVERRKSEKS